MTDDSIPYNDPRCTYIDTSRELMERAHKEDGIIDAYPHLFRLNGRAHDELGLFTNEGCIEAGIYTAEELLKALSRYPEDELTVEAMCNCGVNECDCAEGSCDCEDEEDYDWGDDDNSY